MSEMLDRARSLLERRTTVVVLGTADSARAPESCILVAPRLSADGVLAGGEEEGVGGRTFRNLRLHPRAAILALDPIVDPRSRDGLRISAEFLGAEEDGDELKHLNTWLAGFAPGRRIVRRLLFKVLEVEAYRPSPENPVLSK